MPEVSFLVPVYNGENYVQEAIFSLLRQTFRDFEIVVVNDGSTDATREILSLMESGDSRIKVVHQANGGIVSALNRAFLEAKGRYIARMDCDDLSHPDRLRLQYEFMERFRDVVVCGTNYKKFGKKSGCVSMPESDRACKLELFFRSCFAHPAVLIRRDAMAALNLPYREGYKYAEDYDLWCRLQSSGKFFNLQESLLSYRIHEEQTGSSKRPAQLAIHNQVAREQWRNIAGVEVNFSLMEFLEPESWSQLFRSLPKIVFAIKKSKLRFSEKGRLALHAANLFFRSFARTLVG